MADRETFLFREAAEALRHGNEDAQYLACLLLRHLGHECWGNDYWENFYWTLDGERIDPDKKPKESYEGEGESH